MTVRTGILQRIRDERGAVAVIVALLMVALLGAAAFAVDVGAMDSERAQLQNAADAAALGVAQACSKGNCGNMTATAQHLANLNSNDGSSNVVVSNPTTTSVHVIVTTRDAATGAGYLSLSFAPVLGIKTKQVEADATASWGVPNTGPDALGLTFAPCVFNLNGPVQVITIQGGASSCSSTSPSGRTLPGNFGWLSDSSGTCTPNIWLGDIALGRWGGVSISADCEKALIAAEGQTVLLPVYSDEVLGLAYVIQGWAAFRVLGWNFPSATSYANTTYPGATCTGSCKGLIGQFVSFVSLDNRFSMGGGPSFGASIITLN
jgi:hypothetical protein